MPGSSVTSGMGLPRPRLLVCRGYVDRDLGAGVTRVVIWRREEGHIKGGER